jgi:hypothetical protein
MSNCCELFGCNYPLSHTTEQHLKMNSEHQYWKNIKSVASVRNVRVSIETIKSSSCQHDTEAEKKIADDKLNRKHT